MNIDLSQSQYTPAGKFLSHLYYQTAIIDLIDRDDRSGFPHNGGEHTLRIHGVREEDIVAFLAVIKESYPEGNKRHEGAVAFLASAQTRMAEQRELLVRRQSLVVPH